MSFPKWTSMGRREATRPRYVKSPSRGVTLPSVVILRAPISFNIIMVRAMLSSRGGSMTRASKETGSPQSSSFVRKTACSRGQRNISGVTSSGRMLYTKSKVGTNVKITHCVMCLLVVAATRDHPVDHAFVQTSYTTFSLDAARLWRPLDLKNTKSFKTKQINKTFHFGVCTLREVKLVSGSAQSCLTRQKSITYVMSGTVNELSAMLVDRIIFR